MSEASEVHASAKRADRATGKSLPDIVHAVDTARAARTAATEKKLTEPPPVEGAEKPKDQPAESSEATEVATVVEGAPPAETPREGRMLADIRAREKRLVEDKQRFKRESEEFAYYKRRVETELATARESNALAQSDPFAWFEKYHGIKRTSFGAVAGGKDPAPNIALEQANARIEKLVDRISHLESTKIRETADAVRDRELEKFVADARGAATRWPLAAKYSPDKLKARGWELAVANSRKGVTLSNDEVLDLIEEELSEIASLRAPKSAAVPPKSTESTGSEAQASRQPTLTSRGASEAAPDMTSPLKLKRREMIERTVRAVEETRKQRTT